MSFNTPNSHFTFRPTSQQTYQNLTGNNSFSNQGQFANVERYKTQETNGSYVPHFNSTNFNLFYGQSKHTHDKLTPQHFQRKFDAWKHAEINTAKSLIFTQPQRQPTRTINTKRTFTKITNLSEMAKTVHNIDDSEQFDTNKNIDSTKNIGDFIEIKSQNVRKFGNALTIQPDNFNNTQKNQHSFTNYMFYSKNEEKPSTYKSFINPSTNNSDSPNENKKSSRGLEFLLKFKKDQQEKKQKQTINNNKLNNEQLRVKSSKVINGNANGNLLYNNTYENNASHKFFHEYSAPEIGYFQRNCHHEPVAVHSLQRNQNHLNANLYNLSNHANKYSPPVQQFPSQTFVKKITSDKIDRYVPQKSFRSESQLPNSKDSSKTNAKQLSSFAKKDNKVGIEQIEGISQNIPTKDKFLSPSFFKSRQNKVLSNSKTVQTTPSPTSFKHKLKHGEDSPTYVKSIISQEGTNDERFLHEDLNSQKPKQWSLNDFQLGDKLGKGAFGDVFIAREKHLGFICVLKRMSKKRINELKRQEHVLRQLKIQLYLSHRHLTSMYGFFHDNENIYLILEYLPDGNLAQIKRRKRTSQKQTAQIIHQVCQGLSFMHKQNIIHRDLKPQNIFVNEGYIKVGDFGCSVSTDEMRRTVVSCLEYSSPQQLNGQCYNEKIDVWGVGVLAYELLVGRSPFEREIMSMNMNNNGDIKFSEIEFPQQLMISPLAQDFVKSLLNIDPIERINIHQALQHNFITTNYQGEYNKVMQM